jgi:hypothetical protein
MRRKLIAILLVSIASAANAQSPSSLSKLPSHPAHPSVYDGRTFEQRAIKFVRTGPAIDFGEALTGPGIHGLYRRVDKTWLPNPPQTAAQNVRLRDATWALIEPGLANTIPTMLAPQ